MIFSLVANFWDHPLPMLSLFPPPISWKYKIFFTKIWILEVVMHSAHTALMCQYFALLLFQLMPNLNKSAVILWKCNNPLFAWITLAESKRKKLFGATMELINDALERRCFGSSIMLKWCKGFSIQLTPSRVTMGLDFFLKYDYHFLVYKIYSVDRQWRLELIHTLLLSPSIPNIKGYGLTQDVINGPHCT